MPAAFSPEGSQPRGERGTAHQPAIVHGRLAKSDAFRTADATPPYNARRACIRQASHHHNRLPHHSQHATAETAMTHKPNKLFSNVAMISSMKDKLAGPASVAEPA